MAKNIEAANAGVSSKDHEQLTERVAECEKSSGRMAEISDHKFLTNEEIVSGLRANVEDLR